MSTDDTINIPPERVLSILPGNGGPKGFTSKLGSVEVGSPDSVYMVAAFCFDVMRRLQYMYKLARPYADQIPPNVAQEILADHDAINADGLSWQQRAETAEQIMLRLHNELAGQWEQNLRQAAGQAGC
jgi:hypothetical protein